jgi:hypothetical protein
MIRDTPVLRDLFRASRATPATRSPTSNSRAGISPWSAPTARPTSRCGRSASCCATRSTNIRSRPATKVRPIDLAEERQAEFSPTSFRSAAARRRSRGAARSPPPTRRATSARPSSPARIARHGSRWNGSRSASRRMPAIASGPRRPPMSAPAAAWCGGSRAAAALDDRLAPDPRVRLLRQASEAGALDLRAAAPGVEYAVCRVRRSARCRTITPAACRLEALRAEAERSASSSKKYRRALERGIEALKTFYNTQLARTWKEPARRPSGTASSAAATPTDRERCRRGADPVRRRRRPEGSPRGRHLGLRPNRQRWLIEHRVLPGRQPAGGLGRSRRCSRRPGATRAAPTVGPRLGHRLVGAFAPRSAAFVRSQMGRGNVHAVDGHDNSLNAAYLGCRRPRRHDRRQETLAAA